MLSGKIIKGIGGFYYVEAAGTVYECRARGNFRQQNTTPLAGDNVLISTFGEKDNRIEKIEPRKNFLLRPSVANVDLLFIVSSTVCPSVNPYLIDRMIATAEHKGIESVVVFTKTDLDNSYAEYREIYEKAGYQTIVCNNLTGEGAAEAAALISGKTCVLAGNTGVGKSSLLNAIDPALGVETGETSKKLGRGRHTTRQCSLFPLAGGYIVDTPGFSSFENGERIYKDELAACFREFRPLLGQCRFVSCAHVGEKGCAVCEAVKNGEISESRHKSYVEMYNEVKDIAEWERNKQRR